MEDSMKQLDYKLLCNNLKQDQFSYVVDTLKEIEYANPSVLPLLYKYKYKIKEEAEDTANEIC